MMNDKISFESCTSFNPPPKRFRKEQLNLLAPSRFTIHPRQTPSFPFLFHFRRLIFLIVSFTPHSIRNRPAAIIISTFLYLSSPKKITRTFDFHRPLPRIVLKI